MILDKSPDDQEHSLEKIETITFYSFSNKNSLSHLRFYGPVEQLGIRIISGIENGETFVERIVDGDLIVLQRDFPRDLKAYEKVLALARELGKPIVLDIDDLLFELPEDHPDRLNHSYSEALLPMLQALMEVDLITVSTPALREIILPYNQNIVVLPNYLDDHLWHLNPPSNNPDNEKTVTVGYMGSYTHQSDFGPILAALIHLRDHYPSKLQIHFWGMQPPAELASDPQVHWHPMEIPRYLDFVKHFQSQTADIFIAPLAENSFNACKSSIKYLEYGALGAPGVYSNLPPYSSVIIHGHNGLLASSPQEWEECLIQLIESKNLRFDLATNAQRDILSKWMLSQNAFHWLEAYQKAFTAARTNNRNKETQLRLIRAINHQMAQAQSHWKHQSEVLTTRMAVMENSTAWEITQSMQKIRLWLLPHGSRRERLWRPSMRVIRLILKSFRIISKEGFSNFWLKFKRKLNSVVSLMKVLLKSLTIKRIKKVMVYLIRGDIHLIRQGITSLSQELNHTPSKKEGLELKDCATFFRPTGDILWSERLKQEIDVIVPVFNGMEFLPVLFESLFQNTDTPFRLIVVDDSSTNPSVRPFLVNLAEKNKNVILLLNEENKGFVTTVNFASTYVRNHFVILNTDVEVPRGWLQRLMRPIVDDSKVASTTPFTNAGTICSFPKPLVDNQIFGGLDVNMVDSVFRQINVEDIPVELPTAVGFCMGINHDLWEKIGGFDESQFGRGYGEENDWCMRALSAGYRNLMVPNLFVYHKHGGSFPSDEKQKLMQENWDKLLKLHPNYPSLVQKFIAADPLAPLRRFASLILMASSSSEKPLLIVDHELGGGANAYREQVVQERLKSGQAALILTYDWKWQQTMKLQVLFKEYEAVFNVQHASDLMILKDYIQVGEIYYNNLVSYIDPPSVLGVLPQLKDEFGAKLTFLVHDHYALCPSYTLLDYTNRFCNLPSTEVCKVCLPQNANRVPNGKNGPRDILKWRRSWSNLLINADRIICFSKSSQDLLQRVYNINAERIIVQPHNFTAKFKRRPNVDLGGSLCIGVFGVINIHKGSQMVLDVAKILALKYPDSKITVIGTIDNLNIAPNLTVTGPYKQSDLPDLIEKYRINLCFFSSIIPETFSYVTSELMELEMPICSFNIGAPAERIGKYRLGRLISSIDAETAAGEMVEFHNQLRVYSKESGYEA